MLLGMLLQIFNEVSIVIFPLEIAAFMHFVH